MFLSNAIALAQESGCFDRDPRESRASFSKYDIFKHEWSQIICVFIYLADESLSMRLGPDTLAPSKAVDAVRDCFSSSFASLLSDSIFWESYYELTLVAKKARELLQPLKRAGPAVSAGDILPELEHVERELARWKRQHMFTSPGISSVPPPVEGLELTVQAETVQADEPNLFRACVDIDYQYLVMYSFAPATHATLSDGDTGGVSQRGRPGTLRKLADRAATASREMLTTITDILGPSSMLKYVPVRCWQFIVAANLHLLKVWTHATSLPIHGTT